MTPGINNQQLNDSNPQSSLIASKYKIPLSTIQRRARPGSSRLKKEYNIDIRELGWRSADLLVALDKGECESTAKKILDNNKNVINAFLRIGHPQVNLMAKVF